MTTIPDPQIYRAAAEIIRENGLCKRLMIDLRVHPEPARCPMSVDGAIRFKVSGRTDVVDAAATAVLEWFDEFMGATVANWLDVFGDYVGWNDAPERTEAEVIDALECAAVEAESARAAAGGETR